MRFTILMSNIAMVPRFQKLWVLTSVLDSAGTSTCPFLLANTADQFTVVCPLPPPPWASPTMSSPPSAVSPSCRAPALAISPCTALLFIFCSWDISLRMRKQDPRAPQSFAVSSYCTRTRTPFGHYRACSIEKLLPQPLQVVGMS